MKKLLLLLSLAILIVSDIISKPVDAITAKNVGQSFLSSLNMLQIRRSEVNLKLVYTSTSTSSSSYASSVPTNYYYVFNNSEQGFIIISADDNVIPILGYSTEGTFDPNNIPSSVQKWFEGYKSQIREAIDNNIAATTEIKAQWAAYSNGTQSNPPTAPKAAVAPMLQTKWNQSPYVNDLCPYDNQNAERTVTGCVATAMAQIMKFWNQPATGSGFHSYNHSKYGTLSANFGSTTYQYGSMPNTVNSANSAVSTLMYHCGISVDMNYDIGANGGSGAYVISSESPVTHCSEYAFKTYFGYKSTLSGKARKNYSESQWISMLKSELDAGRPVLYAGFGSGGGHCFVCDGYDNNSYFHFNWGWGGAYDGYFAINALNPSGVGTGGGSGGFNSGHQAIFNLEPTNTGGGGGGGGNANIDMQMYSSISLSANPIWFTSAFSSSFKVANYGPDNFSGEIGAAVFDENYNFVDFMDKKTIGINSGYYDDFSFNNPGSPKYVPGTYYLAVFYKQGNSDWTIVKDGSYSNLKQFTVEYSTDIEVYSNFTITGNKLVQKQSATVNVDIINSGSSNFIGSYRLDLSNLDGTTAQSIQIINETNGLQPNYHYTNGLDFNGTITVAPGTYLLSVAYKANNSSSWYYAGSSNFKNPIYVIVEEAPPSPDMYENNNTKDNAYNFNLSFNGETAKVLTTGSNVHIGTDNDYYKFNLPAGGDYTVTARVHDLNNSRNGNTYSVDVLFSLSKDGMFWSDTYDDIMSSGVVTNGGSTFYIRVAPYFTGSIGTYLLDITVNKGNNSGVSTPKETLEQVSIYPNPAQNFLHVDLTQSAEHINQIRILNSMGQMIAMQNISNNESFITIPLEQYANGIYFVQLFSETGISTKKIIINK